MLLPAMLGLHYLFTNGLWTEVPMKYWLRQRQDDRVAVSWTVDNLKRHPLKTPIMVLLGGSRGREAVSWDSSLSTTTLSLVQQMVAYNLSTSGQNFAQQIAIIDNLPDIPTTVLLGLTINSFTSDQDSNFEQAIGSDLLLESPMLRRYFSKTYIKNYTPLGILPGVLYYIVSYSRQHLFDILRGEGFVLREYNPHVYDSMGIHTIEEKRQMIHNMLRNINSKYFNNYAFNEAMLYQAVNLCKKRNFDVLMIELPSNKEVIGDAFDAYRRHYHMLLNKIAVTFDIPYIDFSNQLPLTNKDYYDLSHLLKSGRIIWEHKLLESLASLKGSGIISKKIN